jgi:hypothetical protein
MPQYDGLLMRDTTDDTGIVPSPGYPFHSPDVICHAQVADAQTFFKNNYNSDPNQPAQLGSQVNYIYVRAKNLATTAKAGWYIHVYRSSSSLFMTPSIWKNNPLSTQSGDSYVTLGTLKPGEVGVGNANFLLSGLASDLFCLVGIASATPTPSIPASFGSFSDYIVWVRSNQNVCGTNVTMLRDYPNQQWDRLDSFSNPSGDEMLTTFKVEAKGPLPANTSYGIRCAPLGIDARTTVGQKRKLSASGFTPGNFSGNVETWGSLAVAGKWPAGAMLETTVYVGLPHTDAAAIFATPWDKFPANFHKELGMQLDTGRLVQIGTTGTSFVR